MEKIFSAAEPQVAFAKPLPQTKPSRPHQSQMLGTRFSFGLLIFSEDGRVKVGDSQKSDWSSIIKPVKDLLLQIGLPVNTTHVQVW